MNLELETLPVAMATPTLVAASRPVTDVAGLLDFEGFSAIEERLLVGWEGDPESETGDGERRLSSYRGRPGDSRSEIAIGNSPKIPSRAGEEAARFDWTGEHSYYNLGLGFLEMGLTEEAISLLRTASDFGSKSALNLLVICHLRRGECVEALRLYLEGLLLEGSLAVMETSGGGATFCRCTPTRCFVPDPGAGKSGHLGPDGSRYEVLQNLEVLKTLSPRQLRCLADRCLEIALPPDQVVCQGAFDARGLFVVQDGQVEVYEVRRGGETRALRRLGPGDYFHDLEIQDDQLGTIRARTCQSTRLLIIPRADLSDFLERHPEAAARLVSARRGESAGALSGYRRRRSERIPVQRTVTLVLEDATACLVRIDNMSPDGLCFCSVPAAWSAVGQEVSFHLSIGAGMLQFGGRVAWLTSECVGIEFTGKSDTHDRKIRWALRNLRREPEY